MMKFVQKLISHILTFTVCVTFIFANCATSYASEIRRISNAKTIKVPSKTLNNESRKLLKLFGPIANVKYQFEEEEESSSCYKENEAPPTGEEDKCCGDLQFYDGKCSQPPQFSRKKCYGYSPPLQKEKGNVCGATEACMRSDIEDMFSNGPGGEEKNDELEKMIAKRENGFWAKLFKPKANDKTCRNDRRCESWNCVRIPRTKGGKVKKKKNGKIKYKLSKRCKPLYVCRCVESGERIPADYPNAKCCPGLKKDIGNTCRDPRALSVMYPEFNDRPAGFDAVSCAVNPPPLQLFNYIKNTFALRGFEFLTATAGNTNACIMDNINKKLKGWGKKLRDDRLAVVRAFQAEMRRIKQKRNELVNAKFQAHQTFTDRSLAESTREQAIAADRVTGKEMIKLMIEEQKLMSKYEESLSGVLKKHEPQLKAYADEYGKIKENKKVKRCRGLFTSKKNKRRWKHRYKVKDRQSNANSEAVKRQEVVDKMADVVGAGLSPTSLIKKKIYFLHDPLMPGERSFKEYGQAFLRKGKYRKTLGKPGFIAYLVGFLAGGLVGAHFIGQHYNKKASKTEKTFLLGVRKNMYFDVRKYFENPPLNGDLELGIDPVCLKSNFEYSSQDSYKDDKEYQDTADYFEKQPDKEEEREPASGHSNDNETINYDNSAPYAEDDPYANDPYAGDEYNYEEEEEVNLDEEEKYGNMESRDEEEGGGVNYREGKRVKNQKNKVEGAARCIRTKVAIDEIGTSAFAQFWLYSYGNKRKYESFSGQSRHMLLQSMSGQIMQSMSAYLDMMHAFRFQSITCLNNKLQEYDWGREAGVIAEKDEYKNEAEKVEWQKSKQAKLECKNCNLKGAGGAIGIDAKNVGTSSISGSPYSFNTVQNPLLPRDQLDLKSINKNYASYKEAQRKRNAEILKEDPQAKEKSDKVLGFMSVMGGPSKKGVAQAAGFDLKKLSFSKHRRMASDDSSQESKADAQQDNMIVESGQAKTLAAAKGRGAKAKDGKKAEGKSKKDLKKFLSDDLFGDLEKARAKNKGKNYTGLSDKEENNILKNVSKVSGVAERGEISTDSTMSLFKKVSKAYVREAYPRLLDRKKKTTDVRLPSSIKSKPKKNSILDQFKQDDLGVN